MNNFKYFFALVCLSFLFTTNIEAQTATTTEGCAPLEVQFFASTGSSSYFWDFQDNATSTLENPFNTFIEPGTFVVEFREMVGGPIIGTVTVTVYPTPVLNLMALPVSGCTPLNVAFESTSMIDPGITVNNYQWVFGDGGIANNTTTPTHTYIAEGVFTISLSIETNDESCNVTQIFDDVVTASAATGVSFTTDPSPASSCNAPFVVSFDNTTTDMDALSYEWNFGNGTTFSGESPGPQTFESDGSYTVVLTATDALGCSGTFSEVVSVGTPTAFFIIPDTLCINVYYDMLNASDEGTYLWNFGQNAIPQVTTAEHPDSILFTASGDHDITLTVTTPAGCVGDTTITVYIDEADASYTRSPIYSCEEPLIVNFDPNSTVAAEWDWYFGDGQGSIEENPVHVFYNNDTTTYSINGIYFLSLLEVTNPSGCKAEYVDTVWLREPNALFMPDVINGCAPLTVVFSDSSTSVESIILWEWDYGDGQTASYTNGSPHSYVFTDPGEYQVQLIITNDANCIDTSYLLTIEVGDAIVPNFEVDITDVCPGDSVYFTNLTPPDNIDAYHFTTDNNRSFHCYGEPEMTWAFVQETDPMDGTLTVEYNGCYSSLTLTDLINVKGPIAQFNYLVDCAHPFDISFTDESKAATSLTWDFGDGTSSTLSTPLHTYDTTGVYWVKLTAENNASACPASVDSIQIYITDIQAFFEMDTLLCTNTIYTIDASASVDVDTSCWRGYSWYTSYRRPITTHHNFLEHALPAGEQSLTLVTRDINGCRDTATLGVKVFDSTPAFALDDDRICFPATVAFTDMSTADTTIVAWQWLFGDGTNSTDQNTVHTYTQSFNEDTLTVGLITTDAIGCQRIASQKVIIYKPISFILSEPFPNLCVGQEIEFTATDYTAEGSMLDFVWDFDNGETGTGINTNTSYDVEGNYIVQLNYEEISSGCHDSTTVGVAVQEYPAAAFTSSFDSMSVICYPQNALFMNGSSSLYPMTYEWDFDNGQLSTVEHPAASFGKGTFEVELIVSTPFGCSDTTSSTYTLIGPEGDFVLDPDMICLGDVVNFALIDTLDIGSYSWDFGDGVVLDNVNPASHQYNFLPPSGQTFATLILVSADAACTLPIEKPIFIHETKADFIINDGIDTSTCINETVLFMNNSSGEDIYNWNFGDGTTSTFENPDNTFTQAGDYDVLLAVESSAFGCIDEMIKTIRVYELPNTAAIGDTICEDAVANLNVTNPSAGSVYIWTPDNLINNNNTPNPITESLNINTFFTVEETDEHGCVNSSATNVLVIADYPSLEWDDVVCEGADVLLPFTGNANYTFEWNPVINNCDTCSMNLIKDLHESVTYTLTATNALGLGCEESVSIYKIEVIPTSVEIPNAFTPDADGVNDYFNPIISSSLNYEDVVKEFKIWNRFGELVYDNETSATGWNGTYKGKPAPSDVYIFTIRLAADACELGEKVGDVSLIR